MMNATRFLRIGILLLSTGATSAESDLEARWDAAAERWTDAALATAAESDDPRQWAIAARELDRARQHPRLPDGVTAAEMAKQANAQRVRADALVRRMIGKHDDDEFVLWTLAVQCPGTPAACDEAGKDFERLVAIAGDNAAVQVARFARAAEADDAATQRAALRDAAAATHETLYVFEALDAAHAAFRATPVPAELLALADPGVTEADIRLTFAMMLSFGAPLPPMGRIADACRAENLPADDPAWAADCLALGRTLERASDNTLGYTMGLRMQERLLAGTPEGAAVRERRRGYEWVRDSLTALPDIAFANPAETRAWLADRRAGGEVHAMREQLRRQGRGVPPEPPADWEPRGWTMPP